jgi:hypothetical protein
MVQHKNGVTIMQVTYGQYEIDTGKLPPTTIDALVRRGISHVLGNEAASKVSAWADNAERIKAEGNATDEQKAQKKAEFQAAFIDAMVNGTLGQHTARGPRVDPIESAANGIAKREVIDVLRGAGLKQPKGEAKVKFADGQEFTMAELVERRLAKHGERITREAQKHVADLERKAKRAKEEAAKAGIVTSDALGL